MQNGADQLRAWMKRRGFTQQEAADFFRFDFTFISKLVNGHRSPGLVNAVKIERETGIPVEAWMSSQLDEPAVPVSATGRKRK